MAHLDGPLNAPARQIDLFNPLTILLEVYDDFLISADRKLNLSRYAGRIILDTGGFYVIPRPFKLKLFVATMLLGILWPLFGAWVFCLMICKVRELLRVPRATRRRCSCQRDTGEAWIRILMILVLYIAGCAHGCLFLPNLIAYIHSVNWEDCFEGNVSFVETVEPSVLLFLLVSFWTLEIALLRLEQSAAAQLSNELKEYDDWVRDASSDTTGGIDDLKRIFDLLGSIFFTWHEGERLTIEKSSGRDLYLHLFKFLGREGPQSSFNHQLPHLPHNPSVPFSVESNASSAGDQHMDAFRQASIRRLTASGSWNHLQVEIDGERLSSQVRMTLQRRYDLPKLLGWMAIAALQASLPMLTRLAHHQPALVSGNAGRRDELLYLLFIPINFVALMNFFAYWDDALRRLNSLTELLGLILYLFGTKSSRTAIGGQFSRYIDEIFVTWGAYNDTRLSDIDCYDTFFEEISFRLWKGGDKVNYQTIHAFLCMRKYMNIVVATERVRVQLLFYTTVFLSFLCLAGAIMDIYLNRGTTIVPVTAVVCIADLVLLSVVLTQAFSTTACLNEVLADATTFLLESWTENIHMQRVSLLQEQPEAVDSSRGAASVETADRALEFLIRFVEKRQVSIDFCCKPIANRFRNSMAPWGILMLLVSIAASLIYMYVGVYTTKNSEALYQKLMSMAGRDGLANSDATGRGSHHV